MRIVLSLLLLTTSTIGAAEPIYLRVFVPSEATLAIDGVRTSSTGPERTFVSPPVPAGKEHIYTLRATWQSQGATVARMAMLRVKAGQRVEADLRPGRGKISSEVLFVPAADAVIDEMLASAGVTAKDVVYDLGCGDGRILIAAAKKYGARGVGIDIDPKRVEEARALVKKAGLQKLIEIRHGDALKVKDLERATVVTLFMLTEFNERIRPTLEKQLKPGSRVVTHQNAMPGWKPTRTLTIKEEFGAPEIFIYTLPPSAP